MNANTMRMIVSDQYKNETWRKKVEKMSENQVLAIYLRIMKEA